MKTCTKCGETKPKTEFYKDKKAKDGLFSTCKKCHSENTRAYGAKRRRENQQLGREYNLKYRYGVTIEQYNKLYIDQKGCCVICGKHQDALSKSLYIDHCHTTGKVRKLLCHNCNALLGHAKENIEILKKAISYLEEHNG